MKVLLVHPYFLCEDPHEQMVMKPYPPLGILYLSAFLKKHGFQVRVFDGTFQRPEDFKQSINQFKPEVIAFYANFMIRKNILKLIAEIEHDALKVVGGPDTTHYVLDYLEAGLDVVIKGEGEQPLLELLENVDQRDEWHKIAGLGYKYQDLVYDTPSQKPKLPIDDFPFPDRQAIDLNQYLHCWEKHHGYRPINLITTRGCPFQCTWCSHTVYGHTLRKRSVENVIAEMQWLHENYDFDTYWFADDVFTIKKKWNLQLGQALEANPHLLKPFETITRADKLDEELVQCLKGMKCRKIWIGAESGSQKILDAMKRGVTKQQVSESIHMLNAAGIETGMFFMWGYFGETIEDILETVDFAAFCKPNVALTTVSYPIKGTPYFQEAFQQGLLLEEHRFQSGSDRDNQLANRFPSHVYAMATQLMQMRLQVAHYRNRDVIRKTVAFVLRLKSFIYTRKLVRASGS